MQLRKFIQRNKRTATDLRLLYSPTLYLLVFFPQCPSLFFVFCFIQNSTAIHVKNVYEHAETRHKQLGTYVSPLEGLKISYRTLFGEKTGRKKWDAACFSERVHCVSSGRVSPSCSNGIKPGSLQYEFTRQSSFSFLL